MKKCLFIILLACLFVNTALAQGEKLPTAEPVQNGINQISCVQYWITQPAADGVPGQLPQDLSAYTDEELQLLLEQIEGELQRRSASKGMPALPAGPTYILNTNSKKFHIPSCASVERTKEKNKQEFFGEKEELLKWGYAPCNVCNP